MGRDIATHPCHGLGTIPVSGVLHHRAYLDKDGKGVCERCGTAVYGDNKLQIEGTPLKWAPEPTPYEKCAHLEVVSRAYAIEIDIDRFTDLLDSESYVTGNAAFQPDQNTLCDKLAALPGVDNVDYNGHFGNGIFLTIDANDDNEDLRAKVWQTIEEHLAWCVTLPKAPHVVERREADRRAK